MHPTRRPIAQSHVKHSIAFPFGSARLTFNLVGNPHVPKESIHRLAWYHAVAFFGFLTYCLEKRKARAFNSYTAIHMGPRSDWGNLRLREFADLTKSWIPRMWLYGADGYFRLIIRRRAATDALWSFAVEWNKSYRVLAFL